ncbi:MAG TPA: C45 family peptidase [Thermoplasmata archaeon]|nr:C45 family peptidase [Thermoplasmata archaeon]
MSKYGVSAALAVLVLAMAALSVPMVAKQDGGGPPNTGDTVTLYLCGTPREMGMQYGKYASDAIAVNVDAVWDWAASEGMDVDDMVATALAAEQYMTADMIEQLQGMSETSGVSYHDLLVLNVYDDGGSEQKACTNFAAAGSGTFDGQALSSKNRDLNNIQVLLVVEPLNGYKFFGMMSAGALGIAQGINEKGLAIGHTWMPVPEYDESGLPPFIVNQLVMENCADVPEAIAYIDDAVKREGATFGISDSNVAAFVESVPTMYAAVYGNDIAVEVIENGVSAHTNQYMFEPFYTAVIEDGFGYMWTPSYARYDRAFELIAENPVVDVAMIQEFTRDLENWGVGSPAEVTDAHPEIPEDCWTGGWPGYSICNARTVSASVFTTDKQYPEYLSVMYMAINNPAWAPYVPVHNGMLQEPEQASEAFEMYIDGRAWALSMQLRSLGDWGDLIPTFEAWESEWFVETAATESFARKMLDAGKVDKAVDAITSTDCGIATEAIGLMIALLESQYGTELVAVPVEA